MLPTTSDIGARLAAVVPTALEAVLNRSDTGIRGAVVVVVDGLGWFNLQDRRGHARAISSLDGEPILTVMPSTTAAALSTLTTGSLPGEHGLIGYRIRHPRHGMVTTLSDWDGILDVRTWQRCETQFERAQRAGVSAYTVGRGTHRGGGLTKAMLTGATYVSADTIESRVDATLDVISRPEDFLAYVYFDEIDRAGHRFGWESDSWTQRLEQLDHAIGRLIERLPPDVGLVLTADHGMVDVPVSRQILFDDTPDLVRGVRMIGGEPRFRYLYLEDPAAAEEVAARIRGEQEPDAWVFTRKDALEHGLFGATEASVAERIGDVIIAAREDIAFYVGAEDAASRSMIGQHGSFSSRERTVPLLRAGAFS